MNIFIEPEFSESYKTYPIVLVDIGASGGIERNWKPAKKYLQLVGFEPDEREFSNLEKQGNENITYLNTAVYKEKTVLDYYLAKKQMTSSIFKPNLKFLNKFPESDRFETVKNVKLEADTLDNQLKINKMAEIDFIKVDTQGSELYILQGALETIENSVFGIEVEVEFSEMYISQPLFADVDVFMRNLGFQLFDIQKAHWKRKVGKNFGKKKGQLVWGNALYFKTPEKLIEIVHRLKNKDEKKAKILNSITICFLYGYYDYAMEILEMSKIFLKKSESVKISEKISHYRPFVNKDMRFRGRGIIAKGFNYLWELWRPMLNGWSMNDNKLGNAYNRQKILKVIKIKELWEINY